MAAVLDDTVKGPAAPIGQKQICGGSLIAPTVVLTAAHCALDHASGAVKRAAELHVLLGREDLDGAGGEVLDVARVVVDPDYDATVHAPDLALLQLATPSAAPVIGLGDARAGLAEGQKARAVGWGNVGNDTYPNHLLEAALPLWNTKRCGAYWGRDFQPGLMLCASSPFGGADACDGDSGGPLVVADAAGALKLFGVVSFGTPKCGLPKTPGVFAWVASPFLRAWVARRSAALAAGDPDETPPALARLKVRAGVVRYSVSEASEVDVQLVRVTRRRITQVSTALVQRAAAGSNRFRLPRALRGHALRRGSYVLRALAYDAAGNRSRTAETHLNVR
jgi:hypothetical protein